MKAKIGSDIAPESYSDLIKLGPPDAPVLRPITPLMDIGNPICCVIMKMSMFCVQEPAVPVTKQTWSLASKPIELAAPKLRDPDEFGTSVNVTPFS